MKIAVVNGLLSNENEMKRILDLVVHEFDQYDLVFNFVDLNEEKLNMYDGTSNAQMDQIFNKILVSDAVIFATSIHMGNITPAMQNLFNYFELNKYKAAMQNKNVLPVVIHNTNDEITAYTMMLNFFKRFNVYEVNKLFLEIPNVITDDYLDKTIKYIKTRTKEFAGMLVPKKVTESENKNINNATINRMLQSNDLKYDENKLNIEKVTPSDKNINELTGMVNDKLKAKAIVEEKEEQKNVNEISRQYKSKIEQIMQETLFGDDEDEEDKEETVAEVILRNQQKQSSEPKEVYENVKATDRINFKKNVEEKIEKDQEVEDLDGLIARVVAKAKREKEELRLAQDAEIEKRNLASSFSGSVVEQAAPVAQTVDESSNYNYTNYENDIYDNFEDQSFEEEYNVKDNFMEGQMSLADSQDQEFVRVLKHSDDELKREANEINEIRFLQTNEVKEEPVDPERFEPESIRELRKKLNSIRMQRNEIVNEVNDMKQEMNNEMKQVEEQKVSISKFTLENFREPHEVIPYEEKEITKPEKRMTLKEMTKNLIYLFKAPENETMKALVQINVEGEEGFSLYINIVDNKCNVFDGVNMNNDITIYVKDEKWRSILDGEVTLQRAFMTGLVKVTGNFMMLNKLDNTLLGFNK